MKQLLVVMVLIVFLGMENSCFAETPVSDDSNARSELELKAQIDAAVQALDKDALFKLAMDFCDVVSPTGFEEEAARFFHKRMQQAGLRSTLQPFAPGRATALGIHEGSGGGETLMFIGHVDTFFPNPEKAELIDGKWIAGSGMSNMKGALAAYLAAVSAVKKAGIPLDGDVLIAASAGAMQKAPVDEFQEGCHRGYAVGTQHMLVRGAVADMCILGEPTKLDIITQHFGHAHLKISYNMNHPDLGIDFFEAFDEWAEDYRIRKTTAGIVPPVAMIGIRGGDPWNGDLGHLKNTEIYIRIPTPPQEHANVIRHEMRGLVQNINDKNPLLKATADLFATNSGAYIPEDSPLVKIVQEAHRNTFGEEPRIGAVWWHSDATHLNRYGMPTVNYGASRRRSDGVPPGDHLHVDDLLDMTRVYIDLIVRVCGASAK